jgi:hypothetical protein
VIRRWIEALERVDVRDHRLADVARLEEALDARHARIEVAVVGDAQDDAMGPADRNHPIAVGHIHRHRLLAEHVLPRFGGGDCLLGVQMDRRGDVHGLDVSIVQELAPVCVPAGRAEFLRERFREAAPVAGNGDELGRCGVAQRRRHALARNVAGPDKSPPERAHSTYVDDLPRNHEITKITTQPYRPRRHPSVLRFRVFELSWLCH